MRQRFLCEIARLTRQIKTPAGAGVFIIVRVYGKSFINIISVNPSLDDGVNSTFSRSFFPVLLFVNSIVTYLRPILIISPLVINNPSCVLVHQFPRIIIFSREAFLQYKVLKALA